jgi:hypothetical protein
MAGLATAFAAIGKAVGVAGAGAASAGLSIAGLATNAIGSIVKNRALKESADFQEKQLEVKSKNEYAIAARRASELRRRNRLEQSTARATGAAFGGGVDVRQLGELAEVGELNALTALWQGESTQAGREDQIAALRADTRARTTANTISAGTTILSGFGSLYDKYELADG